MHQYSCPKVLTCYLHLVHNLSSMPRPWISDLIPGTLDLEHWALNIEPWVLNLRLYTDSPHAMGRFYSVGGMTHAWLLNSTIEAFHIFRIPHCLQGKFTLLVTLIPGEQTGSDKLSTGIFDSKYQHCISLRYSRIAAHKLGLDGCNNSILSQDIQVTKLSDNTSTQGTWI